jgi:hypothetical protein
MRRCLALRHERGAFVSWSTQYCILPFEAQQVDAKRDEKNVSGQKRDPLSSLLDDIRHWSVSRDLIFSTNPYSMRGRADAIILIRPIGDEARYDADIRRGRTWRTCAAMALNGWLLCTTGMKIGYFSLHNLFEWLQMHFLPTVICKST